MLAAIVIPTVPSPVQFVSEMVGVDVVPLETFFPLHVAVPVLLSATPASVRLMLVAPEYVTA